MDAIVAIADVDISNGYVAIVFIVNTSVATSTAISFIFAVVSDVAR